MESKGSLPYSQEQFHPYLVYPRSFFPSSYVTPPQFFHLNNAHSLWSADVCYFCILLLPSVS